MKNKNIIINIVNIILLITSLLCFIVASGYFMDVFPFAYLALLPIAAYVMNKYKKRNSKSFSIYNLITLLLIISSIFFIGYIIYIISGLMFTSDFYEGSIGFFIFFDIILLPVISIDCLINIKSYKNNIIIPVTLFVILICLRSITYFCLFDMEMKSSYFYNSTYIISIVIGLTMISNLIELNRLKMKTKNSN